MSENASFNVEIRRLWPSDMEAFRDHLLCLDARSRHERFFGAMSDDFLVHYAEHCFGQDDTCWRLRRRPFVRRSRVSQCIRLRRRHPVRPERRRIPCPCGSRVASSLTRYRFPRLYLS